jgi:hypothetical protein
LADWNGIAHCSELSIAVLGFGRSTGKTAAEGSRKWEKARRDQENGRVWEN